MQNHAATLLITAPDQGGIVAKVADFVAKNKGNIIDCDQYVNRQQRLFFMRISWTLDEFFIPKAEIGNYFDNMIARPLNMKWRLHFSDQRIRMALFVSQYSHCLFDILARVHSQEWNVTVPLVISNHRVTEKTIEQFGIDFHYIPVNKDNKQEAEARQLQLLKDHHIDLIVLARYMQILSPDFVSHYEHQIINIHHSFLPAFPGSKPYHSAYDRGVKIIGATSHYVTDDLDEGPIIEQDVVRVSHKDTVDDMIRKGRDLEKIVLARAIHHHLHRNIIVYANRTITF